jgi:hypothetical protein
MRRMMPRLVVIVLAIALDACVPPAAADSPVVEPGAACTAPEHRQFDFWIGDWDVRGPQGKQAGRNRITSIHAGCALEEQWSGEGGVTGSSLTSYDASRRQWHQTWVDNTGGVLLLDGAFQDGRMTLRGESAPQAGAAAVLQRVTWQPLPDGRVRQHWESSNDGGTTWATVFDGYYTRRVR